MFATPEPPHRLIAPQPRLALHMSARMLFLLGAIPLFLVAFAAFIFEIINAITTGLVIISWYILLLPCFWLFNIVFYSMLIRYWKYIEPYRFAAVLGNDRLLADEQPQPDSDALPMPVTIRISPIVERRFFLGYLLLLTFLITGFISLVSILSLFVSLPWLWVLLIVICVDILFVSLAFLTTRIRRSIEVSQDGIRFQASSRGYIFMIWHEARLFACYPEPGPWRNSPTMVYELSSASHVLCWTWTQRKSLFGGLGREYSSFEEYTAQMKALCSLVIAKTGLQLYDLSKGPVLRKEELSSDGRNRAGD